MNTPINQIAKCASILFQIRFHLWFGMDTKDEVYDLRADSCEIQAAVDVMHTVFSADVHNFRDTGGHKGQQGFFGFDWHKI